VIDPYFRQLQGLVNAIPFSTAIRFHTERRSETIGYVRGD